MKIIECGTGYTSIPAQIGAATEIVVEELAKSFEKKGINYVVFDVKDDERKATNLNIHEVPLVSFLRQKDVSLGITHKLKRVFYSLSLSRELRREIKKSSEKVCIHFHNQYNMFFFLKTTPKKIRDRAYIFYTVHSYIWNNSWEKINKIVYKNYFQEIYSIKHSDKVFVLNNITYSHFLNHINVDKEKIVKIDNGVNTEKYKPTESNTELIFFQAGSVCERKNQLNALKSLKSFLVDNKEMKYIYAGGIIDDNYKKKIEQFAIDNAISNQVVYAGELKPGYELNEYYNKAKALIFPSTAEAFSLVILESLSCGLPVIMDREAIKEVNENLESVVLFYNNQDEFDNIIKNKILDEKARKEIANKSRKLIETKYSWDVISEKYLKEFERS